MARRIATTLAEFVAFGALMALLLVVLVLA